MLSQELLDKDWGAKVPDYITKGTFSIAVFFMSLTMRGDWIMFLAHYWRSQETTLPAGHPYQLLVTLNFVWFFFCSKINFYIKLLSFT